MKAVQTESLFRRSAQTGNPKPQRIGLCNSAVIHIRSNRMSEITRVYKFGAITGTALIAVAAVVAVLGTAIGA